MNIIEFNNVCEKYRIKFIREGKVSWEEIWALKDISFSVEQGEVLGVIGQNGAGKTTLLKLIAGMLMPDRGKVNIEGRVSVLMELGAGFNPEFTGRENIALNARIYGLDGKILDEKMDKIMEFAGLGKFIDAPIRYYSQGMYMRLAFALAIFVEPDLLLIDDILAVGDEEAQQKCIKKIFELKQAGKTIILVSHDMNMVNKLCNRVILLEKGKIIQEGLPPKVIPYYLKTIGEKSDFAQFLEEQAQGIQPLAQRTISSGNLRLYADVEKKTLRLFYKEKEITKEDGIHSTFNVSKKRFFPKYAQWKIQKVSEKELILRLNYESLSLSQIWTLICREENTLEIKIQLEVNKPVTFSNYDVGLELQDNYKGWENVYEQGEILADQYFNDISPIRLSDNKISKILLKPEDDEFFPQLFFNVSSHIDRRTMSIYKLKRISGNCLNLDSSFIIPQKEKVLNSGRYIYFQGKIVLGKRLTLENEPVSGSVVELKKNNIQVFFDRGKGKIFWGQNEISTGLGVYTSVRSLGIWYDSYQALWEVSQKERDKMLVMGHWPHIPISQIWQIELIEKDSFLWKVDMEIHEETHLEIEQASLMLPSEYKIWEVAGAGGGEFPDEYTHDYDILPYRFWYGKAEEIGAKARNLPEIIFINEIRDETKRAVVENTDDFYRARLLQYQKTNSHKLLPGKYSYFKGVIKIGSGK